MANVVINGNTYEDVPAIEIPRSSGNGNAKFYDPDELLYAASPQSGGSATFANGIHYAQVDSTSTSTKFTATIPGITEYYDGLTIILKNGVVTSASNFTININGLGEKGSYSNLSAATRDTTLFNINYTMMFIYDSTRVSGGCWVCYRGYDANTNTIGYQVRGNSSTLLASQKFYRYRLLFTSADGTHFVPANTSSSTNATDARSVNQTKIDPFGRIVYYGTTSAVSAEASPSAANLWELYTLALGYSFNVSGGTLSLSFPAPVYIKCSPQSDGSAIIDDTTPIVQLLPSIDDNKIYIFLGIAYSATNIELFASHPVYYYKDGAIRIWTNAASSGSTVESDPIFSASPAAGITSTDISNWNSKSDFSGSYNDLSNKPDIPENVSDLNNDEGFITGMEILSYGHSTWADFLAAYNANKVVYCRASSNSNPATGVQGRMAFMAYLNLSGTTPTSVEFQYYRSVSSHTAAQQGDQVYIYKLESNGTWSVTVREAYTKIVAGSGLSESYNNGALTLSSSVSSVGLKVTCTQSASYPYTITANKTYGDILNAFNNGINVIVVLNVDKIYLLDRIASSYISFSHPQYDETYGMYYYQDTIVFNSNDTITTSRGSFLAATDLNIGNALYNLGVKPSVRFAFEYSSSAGLYLTYIDAPNGSPRDFFEAYDPAMAILDVTVYDDLGDVSHFDTYNCAKVWSGYDSESGDFIGHAIFSRSRISVDPDKIYIDEVEIVWDEEMDTCTAEGRTAEVAATAISSIYPNS